jgi:NADP-dependent 3-hydroxy acid dehydrogenase YdfG
MNKSDRLNEMELIILNDGLYQLIPVTKQILDGIVLTSEINCFDLCDILRLKLTGYVDTLNLHIMNDGSGSFIGCMCR